MKMNLFQCLGDFTDFINSKKNYNLAKV